MKKIKSLIIATILLVSLLATIVPVYAQNHVHNINTGEDFATVQNAIDDLNTLDGHTIVIDAVTLDEWNITVGKDLTIKGAGSSLTTIDGNALDSVFVISSGTTVTISDMTITNGNSDDSNYGGGIYNEGTLTINNCTVSGNEADWDGGGIYNSGTGTLTMTNCTVSDNEAYDDGGGIYNHGTLTMENCTVSDNEAYDDGGGIDNRDTLTMTNCTVSGNTAAVAGVNHDGGGIHNRDTLTMTNCTVSDNEAADDGGGICNDEDLEMTNCTVSGNTCDEDGGGIDNRDTLTMTNCTVSDNEAADDGGGIRNGGTLEMTNCTVSGNTCDEDGGGIDNDEYLEMTNCTITGNYATVGGGGINQGDDDNIKNSIIANNSCGVVGPDFKGTMESYGYNLIGDTDDCTITEVANPGTNITGVDPILGPLANNGGPTQTHALLSGSPAIDTGDCTDKDGNPVTTDQRGVSRPQGSGCDIGAYEYVPQFFANPIAAFIPLKNYHLRQVNTCLGCIEENLPEDVPEDVQALLDEMQEHINNANTTGNSIYANNELLKALKCAEDIQEKLGITCPL